MAWGRGREATVRPAHDRRLLDRLGHGERLLAAGRASGRVDAHGAPDDAVGGTDRSLYLPGGVELGWNEVDQAVWHLDESRLDVLTLAIDGPARSYQVHLSDPGRLPELVRERVTSSIVVNQHVALVGRRGAKIIARRVADRDELEWIVVYDAGVHGADPDLKERIQDAVALLRRDLGV